MVSRQHYLSASFHYLLYNCPTTQMKMTSGYHFCKVQKITIKHLQNTFYLIALLPYPMPKYIMMDLSVLTVVSMKSNIFWSVQSARNPTFCWTVSAPSSVSNSKSSNKWPCLLPAMNLKLFSCWYNKHKTKTVST